MKRFFLFGITLFLAAGILLTTPGILFAQTNQAPGQGNQQPGQGNQQPGQGNQQPGQGNQPPGQGNQPPGGYGTGSTSTQPKSYSFYNPLAFDDIGDIIISLTQIMVGVVGTVALAIFIISGMRLIFLPSNEEQVKKSKEGMYWAFIGLVVIFGSYAILVNFLRLVSGDI